MLKTILTYSHSTCMIDHKIAQGSQDPSLPSQTFPFLASIEFHLFGYQSQITCEAWNLDSWKFDKGFTIRRSFFFRKHIFRFTIKVANPTPQVTHSGGSQEPGVTGPTVFFDSWDFFGVAVGKNFNCKQ